jgi:hypothetical protein
MSSGMGFILTSLFVLGTVTFESLWRLTEGAIEDRSKSEEVLRVPSMILTTFSMDCDALAFTGHHDPAVH